MRVVQEMNRVGMIVDCSHAGLRSTVEIMQASSKPVVFSHSNPRALWDHQRNISDAQIKACAARAIGSGSGPVGNTSDMTRAYVEMARRAK